jgi:F0F1-type ATP synthase assembly protein I
MSADRRFPSWVRHSGVGLELAGATAGLALVGYWLDGRFGTAPWGLIAGVILGLVGGLYNLVKESLQAIRDARVEDAATRDSTAPDRSKRSEDGE